MSDVIRLEKQLEAGKKEKENRAIALRLYENHDFRKLIVEGFMTEECARYAQLSADPVLQPNERADALGLAQAAGHLKRFLSVTVAMGNAAEDREVELEAAIEEARQEEGE